MSERTTAAKKAFRCLPVALALLTQPCLADEGSIGFWLPGQFGSLAATPLEEGWSLSMMLYQFDGNASAGKEFDFAGVITAGVDIRNDLLFIIPTYTFTQKVFDAQASVSLAGLYGRSQVDVDAVLAFPGGSAFGAELSDARSSVGDLYPSGSLRWENGDHYLMTYGMLGVPVGSYDKGRLANIGSNHWSADLGGAYTYLNATGQEFSVTAGYTYNWENTATNYRNGDSLHLDWGASQFLSAQWHAGLVGYFYEQVTADSGSGADLGPFKSSAAAIGPQVGYLFELNGQQAYVNLKGYHEYAASNRPKGWSSWLTLSLPLGNSAD